MKIRELWEDYEKNSKDLTDSGRKLAFAAAAICWFFKTPEATFPDLIYISLLFIVLFFLFDIFQALVALLLIRCWTRKIEKLLTRGRRELDPEYSIGKPGWLPIPSFVLFLLKVASLILAYIVILIEFYSRMMEG